ncbi:MAG TPA: L-histidine N(alpha)-methyltransferase [Chloroflexota bacterium]|nr:L-histidine N(alpha)-methyltransferase [Chloroflexota bacterium]
MNNVSLHDLAPAGSASLQEVLRGLLSPQKELPCKLLYDTIGSQLFEQICALDEYYPTRAELRIMRAAAAQMAERIGPECLLIEYGSGSSTKTPLLLDQLERPVAYMPIDISREVLQDSAAAIASRYPGLEVLPICADYTRSVQLPTTRAAAARRVAYYPGSTLGNFVPEAARRFLKTIGEVCGPGGGLLIGTDQKKDPLMLHRAYNDALGITADFNLNILRRLNRELGANFNLDRFRHYAFYNPVFARVEMHLVSLIAQVVRVADVEIPFARGESIWTEASYKYNQDEFAELVAGAGWRVEQMWTDDRSLFSVEYLVRDK